MLAESARAEEALEWLRRIGTTLALDDFGTGYSSLSLLRRLSFGTLKIDRSFVTGLGSEDADERLVRGVIALAHEGPGFSPEKVKVHVEGIGATLARIFERSGKERCSTSDVADRIAEERLAHTPA